MLIEDDIKKYRDFPEEIDIPDDADLLYTGLSCWGMTDAETDRQEQYVVRKLTGIRDCACEKHVVYHGLWCVQ